MAKNQNYEVVDHKPEGGGLIKMWTKGVSVEDSARQQLKNMSMLPFVHSHIAVMPDVHLGKGATVGSVIPTKNAIVPASVGVDLGCGMCAVRTSLTSHDLPHNLKPLRGLIEKAVPHGRTSGGSNDKGSWKGNPPNSVLSEWRKLEKNFKPICDKYKHLEKKNHLAHLGTLGTGNHFVEICLDREDRVWVMLHSGSRGIGNAIGMTFIEKAKKEMEKWHIHLPDRDLSYLPEGSEYFNDYWEALKWAQDFARVNREIMLSRILDTMRRYKDIPGFTTDKKAINCFAGETRVITKFGTKEIKDLVNQEHELLTSLGQWVKAPIKSFGKQKLLKLTVSRCGRFKDIYTTEEHRWIVDPVQRQYTVEKTTKDLEPGDRLSSNFPKHQEKLGEIPAEAIARGFVFGDGSQTSTNRSCANFCGNKDKTILSLFQENNIGLEARKYKNLTRINGLPSEWKNELPSLHENNEYLYGWLAGYFAADGDVDKTGRPTLSSAKIENLRFVRNLATKIGVGTFGIRSRIRSGFGGRESPLHQLGIMRNDLLESFFLISHHRKRFNNCNVYERRHWKVESVKETDRFEEVYCAVVENTHCFTLEDNILTRNCHHNYVDKENHFGHNVYVTRKGAIRAREGDLGIIPGCLAKGTRILKSNGLYENIENLSVGDKIIGGDGKTTTVVETFVRGRKNIWTYKHNSFHQPTSVTPDHLHYIGDLSSSSSYSEGRAKILDRKTNQGENKYKWSSLQDLPEKFVFLLPKNIDFQEMPEHFDVQIRHTRFVPSYELGYVFGFFLGDGCSYFSQEKGGQVNWYPAFHEKEYSDKIIHSLNESLNIKAKTYPDDKVYLTTVHNVVLAKTFQMFGKKNKKKLPIEFWCKNIPYLKGLYDGLIDSDGHIGAKTRKFTNTSKELMEQFYVIHKILFGHFPSVSIREPSAGGLRGCNPENCLESYRATSLLLPQITSTHEVISLYQKIDSRFESEETYDIEVENDDHSFIANNVIVHNSMGAKSFIVEGKGNPDSFCSCSHGAGRKMSRTQAKDTFSLDDHIEATKGVECRKDDAVIDETPMAYKDIEAVMEAQRDLVEVKHVLKQILCVKG